MEMKIEGKVRIKSEAILEAELSCKHDFVSAMTALREEMMMSRYEFLATLSAYLHAEARRDGVTNYTAC